MQIQSQLLAPFLEHLLNTSSTNHLLLQDYVAKIVERSINRVTELQQLIGNFMQFLLDISTIIDYTVKRSKLVYNTARDREGVTDPLVKEVC